MNPLLISIAISAALSGAAGFGLAWKLQAGNIATIESKAKDDKLAQQHAIDQVKERNIDAVIQAQNAAAGRVAVLRRESAAARGALDSLRRASDAAVRAAQSDTATCNRVVSAYSTVFGECTGTVQTLATDAGQCSSAVKTLTEAQPQ